MSSIMLVHARRAGSQQIRLGSLSSIGNNSIVQWYSSSRPALDDAEASTQEDKAVLRKIALEYGRRNADYKRRVSALRKEYMDEYQRNKAEDVAQRDAEIAEATRRHLERQRAKNERTVQNAIRQQELRRQTHLAFQDHLQVQQEKRDERKELFTRAQQLLIDELEEEAPMWLTTPEEVEAAFTPEAEQLLWARPHGVLGAPNPTMDSHFWQNETHTWEMDKTYKTHQDVMLEEYEETVYNETNVDPEFWTPERVQAREVLEQKAKLRALVRMEGRKSLLQRQREYLNEESTVEEGEPPKSEPVPSLGVLANVQAQEREGSELLFKDPTKFFVFDRSGDSLSGVEGDDDSETYSGPSLGAPVGIRDPLRTGAPQGRVFPRGIGKMPKPDMRTEKEKKRQEREEKLWAAAQAQARSDMDEIDMAAGEDDDFGEPIDYDTNDGWDSDDDEWVKGLDPDLDAQILNMPREYRYREEDIDWVIAKLEAKASNMENHVRNAVNSMEQELRSRRDRGGAEEPAEEAENGHMLDDETRKALSGAGADPEKYEKLMQSLSEEQLLSLFALEAERREAGDDQAEENVFEKVPDLTEEQVTGLTEMEKILHGIENEDRGD